MRTWHDAPEAMATSTSEALRRAQERAMAARARVAEREKPAGGGAWERPAAGRARDDAEASGGAWERPAAGHERGDAEASGGAWERAAAGHERDDAEAGGRGRVRASANVARSAARGIDGLAANPGPHHRPFDLAAFEALVGGRVMPWIGGAALVLGLALLAGVAISSGLFGPAARTGVAAVLSAGLALTALRIKQATISRATLAAAIAGGFVTAGMAGPVHHLIPAALAGLLAFAVGGAATAVAVRRGSQGIAVLGILGGIASPLFAGAPTGGTIVLVLAASASAAGVLVWQRWSLLRAGLPLLAIPQVAYWALAYPEPSAPAVLSALAVLGLVLALAAIGYELRAKGSKPSAVSALMLLCGAASLAVVGWFACAGAGQETLGHWWLLGLAVAHAAAGIALLRTSVHREVSLLLIGVGVLLADVAAASMVDGVALGLVWTFSAAGAALLARRLVDRDEQLLAVTGMAGHLVLALAHAFVAVSPQALGAGTELAGAFELALAGTSASVLARVISRTTIPASVALVLDAIGIGSLTFLTGVMLDGGALVAALAGEAVALDVIGRRDRREAGVALPASYTLLGLAGVIALVTVTPPTLLADGFPDVLDATLALGSLGLAALRIARHADREFKAGLYAGTALTTLGLASGLAVSAVGGGQEGQLALTVLWAVAGVGGLAAGIALRQPVVRLVALALLFVTSGKVFLVDLATLTSIYRVGAFVGLGLLLLLGALVWQRQARRVALPTPLRDAREGCEGRAANEAHDAGERHDDRDSERYGDEAAAA